MSQQTTMETKTRNLKKMHSRVPYVKWEKGVSVKGTIERGIIKAGRFGNQQILQVILEEGCKFKRRDKEGSMKEVKVPEGAPVNIELKGGCAGLWDLPPGTYIEVVCLGKEATSNGSEAWAFDVAYEV
jgi:hypothetical protein